MTVDDANAARDERIEHPYGCVFGKFGDEFGNCFAVLVLAVRDITCAVFLINHNVSADFIDVVIVAVRIDSVNTGDFRAADFARRNGDRNDRLGIFQDVVFAVIAGNTQRDFAIGISADVDICRIARACEQLHVVARHNAAERIIADLERRFVVERFFDVMHRNRDGFGRYVNRRFDGNVCQVIEFLSFADEFEIGDVKGICADVLAGQGNRAVFERDIVRALQSRDLERAVDRVRRNRIFAVIDL